MLRSKIGARISSTTTPWWARCTPTASRYRWSRRITARSTASSALLPRHRPDAYPIVAISHHQASTAQGIPIAAVIHHGIDIAEYQVGAGRGGYALFLGRMSPEKGVHVAARVARAAGLPLKIAAKRRETAEQAYFDQAVAPLLGMRCRVPRGGGRHGEDPTTWRRAVPAQSRAWPEPFGMVMIEALACGTPVVATPCGSVPEIVDDGVTGFVRTTEAGLVDALHQVGEIDRALCRRSAGERFTAARMVTEHLSLYRQLNRRHLQQVQMRGRSLPAVPTVSRGHIDLPSAPVTHR